MLCFYPPTGISSQFLNLVECRTWSLNKIRHIRNIFFQSNNNLDQCQFFRRRICFEFQKENLSMLLAVFAHCNLLMWRYVRVCVGIIPVVYDYQNNSTLSHLIRVHANLTQYKYRNCWTAEFNKSHDFITKNSSNPIQGSRNFSHQWNAWLHCLPYQRESTKLTYSQRRRRHIKCFLIRTIITPVIFHKVPIPVCLPSSHNKTWHDIPYERDHGERFFNPDLTTS